jgi:predicted nuclease of restriction endonuclease-like (RecB) superfamily
MALSSEEARRFYETEALRCGWSFRQLDRQISSQFYERTALSRNKTAMLKKSGKAEPGDLFTPEEEIKDPFVLEFLGLKDEYSESDLEEIGCKPTGAARTGTIPSGILGTAGWRRRLNCYTLISFALPFEG